jgi:hypothetical protein
LRFSMPEMDVRWFMPLNQLQQDVGRTTANEELKTTASTDAV